MPANYKFRIHGGVPDYDYCMFLEGGNVYGWNFQGVTVSGPETDAKIVYDTCRVLLEALGGGRIRVYGGTFNFSAPIYLQCEAGGALPDYSSYCILTGNGVSGDTSHDLNATILHFEAGDDGVILDMHTNNGHWYTHSGIEDLNICGSLTQEMDSAISFIKTAFAWLKRVRVYYAGSGGHSTEFINCQMLHVEDLRVDSNIPNNSNIYISNIVGVGYLEQGAHQTWIRCSSGLIGGAAGAGTRAWELDVPSGAANLSNIAFIDCEAVASGAYDTAVRYGWYIHNVAAAFHGITWNVCNFEGLDQTNGERNLYIDTNVGGFWGVIMAGTFVGPNTSIQLDHGTTRLEVHSLRDVPDLIAGSGHYYWYHSHTPGTVTATAVHPGAGRNVVNSGRISVTGAVNTTGLFNHDITMAIAGNLPDFQVTPEQTGHGNEWVVDADITAAQLQIRFDNQPGAGTWWFKWHGSLDKGL